MITLAQRLEALRTERNLSRPQLAAALGFPKTAIEKFETGRQTPTQEQQDKLAAYFGVSLFYLRGASSDRTRMDDWMEAGYAEDDPAPAPAAPRPKKAAPASSPSGGQGGIMDAMVTSPKFQEALRSAVLDALRSPEGQEILKNLIRKEQGRV